MNPQYWTTDDAYKAGYEDGRKEAADRLVALQRVADAAKELVLGDGDKASDWDVLRSELRALESTDG